MAQHEMDPSLMLRLLSGLVGYDESQYREWLLAQPGTLEPSTGDDEPLPLSYHRWNQETMMLLDIRNFMSLIINSKLDPKSGGKPLPLMLPPGSDTKKSSGEQSGLGMVSAMFAGMPTAG
ncbi:MAG: hypothetical protein SOI13_01640 [Bifidobacterium mongoliense]|jgi:hypothetical protein|uniref:hypothetical protein n=1 Tax=Bifidobacterium mongoliense TaxID=518643 RepID=UPI002F35DE7A